jgi:hypothetical protein
MRIDLRHVESIPRDLEPGILYVSKEFGTAHHLCACGCGSRIRTPLDPTEWELIETMDGPTLRPSIGNWQRPCRSHYWIWRGQIKWAAQWTEREVLEGRTKEERKRERYYARQQRDGKGAWGKVKQWFAWRRD